MKDTPRTATAFAIEGAGGKLLVTAAHTLVHDEASAKAICKARFTKSVFKEYRSARVTVLVSALAFAPERVQIDLDTDIALLQMPDEFWQQTALSPLPLTSDARQVQLEAAVSVLGFPGTAAMDVKELKVSDVTPVKITLNGPLSPGFSGGPIRTPGSREVVGVCLRSSDKQTFCLPIASLDSSVRRFPTDSVEYGGALMFPMKLLAPGTGTASKPDEPQTGSSK